MKLVKICGIKQLEEAQTAVSNGANMIGMIMVPGRSRTIDLEVAKSICEMVKRSRIASGSKYESFKDIIEHLETVEFENLEHYFEVLQNLILENGPFAVGVFRNQPISEVFDISDKAGIDIIQLHGNENKLQYCKFNATEHNKQYGVIPRYVLPGEIPNILSDLEDILIGERYFGNGFLIPLLDSEMGGEGKVLDWTLLDQLKVGKYVLAGGLNQSNVSGLEGVSNVIGFDVSGGVETEGVKDHEKIKNFIINSKLVN